LNTRRHRLAAAILACLLATAPAAATAQDASPSAADDLELVESSGTRLVYSVPGSELGRYTKVVLLDSHVAFRDNWQKEYNRQSPFALRVDEKDMQRIRDELATDLKAVFSESLTEAGYEVTTEAGPDVLVIWPAIINLSVTAPDVRTPERRETIVHSAMRMTLFMEFYDSTTQALIGRIIDAEAAEPGGNFMWAHQGSNKSQAKRVFQQWADDLQSLLDDARSSASGDND
jgi:hypothetical protein